MKNKNNFEKQSFKKSLESLSIATYTAYFLSIGSMIFKIIGNNDVQTYYFEILLIVGMTFTIFAYRIFSRVYNLPVSIRNKKVMDLSSNGRASRLIVYSKDAFVFSILLMIVKYYVLKKPFLFLSIIENPTYQVVAEFVVTMIVAIIINIAWFETNIHFFNKTYSTKNENNLK